jgi:hypothetical protein
MAVMMSVGIAAPAVASPSGRAAPVERVMPAAYYGMEEAKRGDMLLREVVLGMHNEERASLGLAPLAWDNALAQDAARYATEMAVTNRFQHSPRASRAIPSGENLWMGPRRLYGYGVMIGAFIEEKRLLRAAGKLPDISMSGRWEDVGHYTQMIWRGTRKLGCAVAEGQNYDYLVCRYFPAGNSYGKGPLDLEENPRGALFAGVGE